MSILEKLILLGKITKTIKEVSSVNYDGIYLHNEDFNRIFGTDNSKFEIKNWGGEDELFYCTKSIIAEGVKIYAIFEKGQDGYCVALKNEEVEFEAAAIELASALGVE